MQCNVTNTHTNRWTLRIVDCIGLVADSVKKADWEAPIVPHPYDANSTTALILIHDFTLIHLNLPEFT